MTDPRNILSSDFYYDLPEARIAKFPLSERNSSKLLLFKDAIISEDKFYNISNYIDSGSLLVFNDTRVIHARIEFRKSTGARIEIFCLEPHDPADYSVSFAQKKSCQWKCMVGNLKKWKSENLEKVIPCASSQIKLVAKFIKTASTYHIIEFEWDNNISFAELIELAGEIPIPPYLERNTVESDAIRYQTVYSKFDGSVAAPTAGLHFTENEFNKLKEKDIDNGFLTLHVGAGTFRPLQSKTLGEHEMHTEHFLISRELIQKLIKSYPKIIAVGTTSVRTIESLSIISQQIENNPDLNYFHVNQWDAYGANTINDPLFALKTIYDFMESHKINTLPASTSIMIAPGYKFKFINGIITNFHQPESTLLALVSALIGPNWKEVYDFALRSDFRFLSYGDSSLLIKP
jgi:S-adenosylmethionine:tRNA ribosyltransferase-isomerase